eukprot:scaffold233539_cov19-Prasinocladus_malaysianus.AAC.1
MRLDLCVNSGLRLCSGIKKRELGPIGEGLQQIWVSQEGRTLRGSGQLAVRQRTFRPRIVTVFAMASQIGDYAPVESSMTQCSMLADTV